MYVPYHVHTQLSNGVTNIDSITNYNDYISVAKECGMKAFGFAEHGCTFEWVHKKEAIEKAGMKYLHCAEVYLTENTNENCRLYSVESGSSKILFKKHWQARDGGWLAEICDDKDEHNGEIVPIDISTLKDEGFKKTRDNYHCVLIARNYDGVQELNKLLSTSFNRDDCHFYYMPRITFEELFATSDNIFVTTACLGGVLHSGTPSAKETFLGFLRKNKDRCFLEIQHHNCQEQVEYNQFLYSLHQETGIPLITGTDSHALNEEHMDGRAMLQRAKKVHFADEDAWDLTFKTPEQLVDAYKKQNSLPMSVVYEAMQNTIVMADMVEEFELDHSYKYPKLYENSDQVFKQKINEGTVRRGINKLPNYKEYLDRIHYEYDVYKHNGAIDFMLLEEDYKSEMRRRGIRFGYSRGSVSGSIIAYILGITEIDSVKYNLNFERKQFYCAR